MAVPANLLVYGGQLLDGATVTDALGIDRLMNGFTRIPGPGFSMQETLANTVIQQYRISSWSGRRGPTGITRNRWSTETVYCDVTMFRNIQRRVKRPIRHNFTDKLEEVEFFDGNGTATVFDLYRQGLGVGYAASGGLGVNGGAALEQIEVRRLDTGASYTIVYDIAPAVATEVRIDTTVTGGANIYRRLTFHTAPPNIAGVVEVTYYALYNVTIKINEFPFPRDREGMDRTSFTLDLTEMGEAA